MNGDKWSEKFQPTPNGRRGYYQRDIPKAQKVIFSYLLDIVKTWHPQDVLEEFKHLFIHHVNTNSSIIVNALYDIVFANREDDFKNTLKRSCYILINNWDLARQHDAIRELINVFSDPIIQRPTVSPTLQRLRLWLRKFINSSDFEELRLFTTRYDQPEHWSQRYTSYLLVPQYTNLENSIEQREAARTLSHQLKEKFKIDLAFYTALANRAGYRVEDATNPTILGEESLRLIKRIIAKRGVFSYGNLASIFKKQTHNLSYCDFKLALKDYLIYSLAPNKYVRNLEQQILEKLKELYKSYEGKTINDALLLRTSNRMIEYLTTEDHENPSTLFLRLMSQGNPLTLVILLLKLVLICHHVRTHLESRVADLIRHYEKYNLDDCQWVLSFFEIFKITMTIHAENIEYTLIDVESDNAAPGLATKSRQQYRIFSRVRSQMPEMGNGEYRTVFDRLVVSEENQDME